MRNLLSSILLTAFVGGCAYTQVTGVRDSAYQRVTYYKPVVDIQIDDLQNKLVMEELLIQELLEKGVAAIRGSAMYPPTRTYSSKEWAKVFMESPADSMVIVILKKGSTENRQIWKIAVLGKDSGKAVWAGESKTSLLQNNLLDSMNLGTMFGSIAKSIAETLIEEGVLTKGSSVQ